MKGISVNLASRPQRKPQTGSQNIWAKPKKCNTDHSETLQIQDDPKKHILKQEFFAATNQQEIHATFRDMFLKIKEGNEEPALVKLQT